MTEMAESSKNQDSFESRVKSAMKARGISGIAELALRLSKRLGRKITRISLCKMLTGSGDAVRVDVALAIADELEFSARWLSKGTGSPHRWVQVDEKTKELTDIFKAMSDAARAELISYGYRLVRITGKSTLISPYPPAPPEK